MLCNGQRAIRESAHRLTFERNLDWPCVNLGECSGQVEQCISQVRSGLTGCVVVCKEHCVVTTEKATREPGHTGPCLQPEYLEGFWQSFLVCF